MQLEHASLFSGIGGFDLAAQRAGMRLVAGCEIEQFPRAVLARRFPGMPVHPDVTTAGLLGYSARHPHADRRTVRVLTAGFPCQDLSVAGKRAGLEGARSALFFQIPRIAEENDVDVIVLENVPGLLSSWDADAPRTEWNRPGRDLAVVLGALVGADVAIPDGGWSGAGAASGPAGVACWRILDAQHFGVPQRRRRWFCVVDRRARGARLLGVLLEPAGLRGDPEPGGEAGAPAPAGARGGAPLEGGPARALSRVGGGDDPGAGKGNIVAPALVGSLSKAATGSTQDRAALAASEADGLRVLRTHPDINLGRLAGTLRDGGRSAGASDGHDNTPVVVDMGGGKGGAGVTRGRTPTLSTNEPHAVLEVGRGADEVGDNGEGPLEGDGAGAPADRGGQGGGVQGLAVVQAAPGDAGPVPPPGASGDPGRGLLLARLPAPLPGAADQPPVLAGEAAPQPGPGPGDEGSAPQLGLFGPDGVGARPAGADRPAAAEPHQLEALGLSENQRGEVRLTPVARQLTTGGGKPGQGYPAVVEPAAFDVEPDDGPVGGFDRAGTIHTNMQSAGADQAETFVVLEPEDPVAFKPGHFTRGKDGGPSGIVPPLTADADKGDQDPVVFEPRVARNGRGGPAKVAPPLKAENGSSGKGDGAPVAFYPTGGSRDVGAGELSPPLKVGSGVGIPSAPAVVPLLEIGKRTGGVPEDGTGVGEEGDPMFTLQARAQHGVGGLPVPRRLTPRECERLQGFPDDWTLIDGASDSARYRALGNAVAVPAVEWILRRLAAALNEEGACSS